jgi:hypothetical protein
MANTAPYEVNVNGTDDETFVFTVPFENADGTPFPFSGYEIEYSVKKGGSTRLLLAQGAGVTIANGVVTFDGGNSPLHKGEYEHGCRIRDIASGKYFQVFDGRVEIGEGNF